MNRRACLTLLASAVAAPLVPKPVPATSQFSGYLEVGDILTFTGDAKSKYLVGASVSSEFEGVFAGAGKQLAECVDRQLAQLYLDAMERHR